MKNLCASAVAVSAVAVLSLAACSGGVKADESAGPVVLDYWSENDSGPVLATDTALVEEFNRTHSDIQIEFRGVSNESFFTVIRNAFTANNPPEIFQHEGNNNLFQFVREDQVLPITDWWGKPGNGDRFTPGAPAASVTYNGEIYGIPLQLSTTNEIYYNRVILENAGIDPTTFTTWGDFLTAFAQLKAQGVTPIAYGNSEGWPGSQWFYNFLAKTAGADKVNQLVARNCGYSWTDPDVVAAAQLYTDLSDQGYFSAGKSSDDYSTAQATFLSGNAAFFGSNSWFTSSVIEAPNPDDYGMVTFPPVAGGNGSATDVLITSGGLAVSKSADTPAKFTAALIFLDWVSQAKQQEEFVKIGIISATSAANKEALMNSLTSQVIAEQIKPSTGSFPYLEHVTPKAVGEDAIWQGSVAVLTGQATAESWMQSVEDAAAAEDPTTTLEENCS